MGRWEVWRKIGPFVPIVRRDSIYVHVNGVVKGGVDGGVNGERLARLFQTYGAIVSTYL